MVAETKEYGIFRLGFHELYAALFSFKLKVEDTFLRLRWQVTCVSSCVRRPFPSKENPRTSERDDLGRPFVPGGQEIGLGSPNLERADL